MGGGRKNQEFSVNFLNTASFQQRDVKSVSSAFLIRTLVSTRETEWTHRPFPASLPSFLFLSVLMARAFLLHLGKGHPEVMAGPSGSGPQKVPLSSGPSPRSFTCCSLSSWSFTRLFPLLLALHPPVPSPPGPSPAVPPPPGPSPAVPSPSALHPPVPSASKFLPAVTRLTLALHTLPELAPPLRSLPCC